MPAVHVADIGKRAKGFIGGDAATGNFVLSPKLTIASTTQSGVVLTATATQKGDKLDASLKAAYTAVSKKYSVDATADPAGKVTINASVSDVAPGVKVTGSVVLPDPAATAKLGAEYASASLAAKATISLTAAPVVDVALGSAVRGVLVGAEATYDAAKADITKTSVLLGYHAPDFQACATLADRLSTLKLTYAHFLSPTATVGAELSRKLADPASTTFALAYGRALAGGASAKLKLDSAGSLSATYVTKLAGGEKLTGSLQLAATDLSKGPKYGFALDLA